MKVVLGVKHKPKSYIYIYIYGSKRQIVEKQDTLVYVPILNMQSMLTNVSVRSDVRSSSLKFILSLLLMIINTSIELILREIWAF